MHVCLLNIISFDCVYRLPQKNWLKIDGKYRIIYCALFWSKWLNWKTEDDDVRDKIYFKHLVKCVKHQLFEKEK